MYSCQKHALPSADKTSLLINITTAASTICITVIWWLPSSLLKWQMKQVCPYREIQRHQQEHHRCISLRFRIAFSRAFWASGENLQKIGSPLRLAAAPYPASSTMASLLALPSTPITCQQVHGYGLRHCLFDVPGHGTAHTSDIIFIHLILLIYFISFFVLTLTSSSMVPSSPISYIIWHIPLICCCY